LPVFISHRTADDVRATYISTYLAARGVSCYLDHFDDSASTKNITDKVLANINKCTHLLALMTDQTHGSWWVPFEIGVGRQADRRITSYNNMTRSALPEYLQEWPVLRSDADLDKFVLAYRADRLILEKRSSYPEPMRTADTFHADLKAKLKSF
jgi:hypothetical protein